MQFILAFLEGIITFVSPCLLPMLPIYISYFAGGEANKKHRAFAGALGFVLGFTVVFVCMGALAGTLGALLRKYQVVVNIVSGLVVIFFGLNYLGVFRLNIFKGFSGKVKTDNMGFLQALLFGVVFSVGWTPCVGAFLGSALMLASTQGKVFEGMMMLLVYSLGLGIPFVLSALLIDYLKSAFNFIKRNYKVINTICGLLLVVVGVLMATGLMGRAILLLS